MKTLLLFSMLFLLVAFPGVAQTQVKDSTNSFLKTGDDIAILDYNNGIGIFGSTNITVYYSNAKPENLVEALKKVPGFEDGYYSPKLIVCIKYLGSKGYQLVSSSRQTTPYGDIMGGEYIFKRPAPNK